MRLLTRTACNSSATTRAWPQTTSSSIPSGTTRVPAVRRSLPPPFLARSRGRLELTLCCFQVFAQEMHRAWPGIGSGLGIAIAVIGVDKGVAGIVDAHGDILASLFVRALDLLNPGQRNARVLSAKDCQNRRVNLRYICGGGIVATGIERHHRAQIAVARCDLEGHGATHAEADQTELLWLDVGHCLERLQRPDNLFGRTIHVLPEQHHHLHRVVRLGGDLAVIEVGHGHHKTLGRQLLREITYMGFDAPPFLDQHYAWMLCVVVGLRHIGVGAIAIYLQVYMRSTDYRHRLCSSQQAKSKSAASTAFSLYHTTRPSYNVSSSVFLAQSF